MSKYIGSVCKLCRREGEKLFLKGNRCLSHKCSFDKRSDPPGQHGTNRRRKISEYGKQLREKQKMKRIYGLLEKQFRLTYERAERMKGKTGDNLFQLLERRLDNVIYRLGLAPSRAAARQIVKHGHILVNGHKSDIPSMLLKPNDTVRVRTGSRKMEIFHESMKRIKKGTDIAWLSLDKAKLTGTFLDVPARADIPVNVNEQLIVELYSK